jgi:hypothetical protein
MNLWQSLRSRVPASFRSSADVHPDLAGKARDRFGDEAAYEIGTSEEGRSIIGFRLGVGPIHVSLIAGNHADEPVGPETLRSVVDLLISGEPESEALLRDFRFAIVPHVNPDGEARNRSWFDAWPSLEAYLTHVQREAPGRDIEFGYPDLRPENRCVSAFLAQDGPYRLHMSLHGLGFGKGALLLIDRLHAAHTAHLKRVFALTADGLRLGLHDENRGGEKGFFYIAPGFWTTPEGAAMRAHFELIGDKSTAALFRDSSMEYVASLGGRPLCLVTEIPIFLLRHEEGVGIARSVRADLSHGSLKATVAAERLKDLGVEHVPLETAVQMHATVLEEALRSVNIRQLQ